MSVLKDLTGLQFGRLTVVRYAGSKNGAVWFCICVCDGKEIPVAAHNLVSGDTKSCGCLCRETNRILHLVHGHADSRTTRESLTHASWRAMSRRVAHPDNGHEAYRDVNIDPRWLGEHGFENFLFDMHERPAGCTLGRFLDSGSYTKLNCSWQTRKEQAAEKRGKYIARALHVQHQLEFLEVA
jgi:hypothetical protein